MTTKKKPAGLLEKMEVSLTSILTDMDSRNPKVAYSLTDKMKIFDRIIKLEQLKQGINGDDDGAGFSDEE